MKIRYEEVKWYWWTFHYDVHWKGYGWYNGKFYAVQTIDETDYDAMTNRCPCCKDGGSDDWKQCTCENMPDLYCQLTPMKFLQIVVMFVNKKWWDWIKRPYLFWQFNLRKAQEK